MIEGLPLAWSPPQPHTPVRLGDAHPPKMGHLVSTEVLLQEHDPCVWKWPCVCGNPGVPLCPVFPAEGWTRDPNETAVLLGQVSVEGVGWDSIRGTDTTTDPLSRHLGFVTDQGAMPEAPGASPTTVPTGLSPRGKWGPLCCNRKWDYDFLYQIFLNTLVFLNI